MAFDWKGALKPVVKSNTDNKLPPAGKVAQNMDRAMANYKAGNKGITRPTIKLVGDEVQFSVRYANRPLELTPGLKVAAVPTAQFEDVFAAIRESVLAGEFDKQLAPLAEMTQDRGAKRAGQPRTKGSRKALAE